MESGHQDALVLDGGSFFFFFFNGKIGLQLIDHLGADGETEPEAFGERSEVFKVPKRGAGPRRSRKWRPSKGMWPPERFRWFYHFMS